MHLRLIHFKKIYCCLVFLVVGSSLYADIHNEKGAMYVTWHTSEPEISNLLKCTESFAKSYKFNYALEEIEKALALSNKYKDVFNEENERCGTLGLCLQIVRLQYLGGARAIIYDEIAEEYRRLIKEYADIAEGKQWATYTLMYWRLITYHHLRKEEEDITKMYEALLEYNPADQKILQKYLIFMLQQRKCITEKTRNFVNVYVDGGGVWDEWFACTNCRIMEHENGDAFAEAMKVLDEYPNLSIWNLTDFLKYTHTLIDADNQDMIKTYIKTLRNFAIRQSAAEYRVEAVGLTLTEIDAWNGVLKK